MARRLGEMQAKLVQLEALGERVSGLAGVEPGRHQDRARPRRRPGVGPAALDGRTADSTLAELDAAGRPAVRTCSRWSSRACSTRRCARMMVPTQHPVAGAARLGLRLAHRPLHRALGAAHRAGLPGPVRHAHRRRRGRRRGRAGTASRLRPHGRGRPWQRPGDPLCPRLARCGCARATWSSAARRSPTWAPPAARPGRTCTSRCWCRAFRRIPTSSSRPAPSSRQRLRRPGGKRQPRCGPAVKSPPLPPGRCLHRRAAAPTCSSTRRIALSCQAFQRRQDSIASWPPKLPHPDFRLPQRPAAQAVPRAPWPRSTRWSRSWSSCPTSSCAPRPQEFKERVAKGEALDDAAARGLRRGARRLQARDEDAPLRRAAGGRHRAAPGQDRRDAHRRGQDPHRHAAGVPERAGAARACTW